MTNLQYRGYSIDGSRGEYFAYVCGVDVTRKTLAEVKRVIDNLAWAGTRPQLQKRRIK